MPVKKPRFTLIDSIAPRIQTRKALFLRKMEQLVDWHALSGVMAGAYASRVSMADAAGRPAYPPILLLKMLLLETWYGLSDTEAEEFALDSLTARQFLGLSLEDRVPDHSSLSRFRARLLSLALYAPLLAEVNRQLEAAGVIVRTGAILDASILETPRRPHRKPRYVVADDREPNQTPGDRAGEEGYHAMLRAEQPGVDPSARWAIKRGPRFGYKRHTVPHRAARGGAGLRGQGLRLPGESGVPRRAGAARRHHAPQAAGGGDAGVGQAAQPPHQRGAGAGGTRLRGHQAVV